MTRTTSLEFQRKFGEFQSKAQRGPVEITRHGRRELVLLSAARYDWMMAAIKRSHLTEELPDTILEAIKNAKMHPRHAQLNKLMK